VRNLKEVESCLRGNFAIPSGTGFIGKVFIERLLRTTEVAKIYMLMRHKKGKDPKERLIDVFNNPVSEKNKLNLLKIINVNKF